MKILVTGGAGFIGANFVYYMLRKHPEDSIVCFDLLTYAGNLETLAGALANKNFKFIRGDIADRKAVNGLFEEEKFDIVVNFAAESHVDRSIENPEIFLVTNVLGTQVLLDAARSFHVKRFHQVSTDEVYGDLPLHRTDLFFTEETPIHTSSPYSASKASADLLTLAYFRTYKLPVTISRCSNNYGPYHFPEKLIPLCVLNALNGKALPIYGDGQQIRDWLYVKDHCSAIRRVLEAGKLGETYNVGGWNEKANLDVVHTLCAILDELQPRADGQSYTTQITFVQDRPGHDRRYAIDARKLEKELGWKPQETFETGIRKTVQWYLENQEWVNHVTSGEYRHWVQMQYNSQYN